MRRRDFIAGLGGAAAWPVVVRAQQADRVRRIAVLVGYAEDDPNVQVWLPAFRQGLEKLGWSEDRNIRIDYRFAPNSGGRVQELAKGIVALRPDAILTTNAPVTAAVHEETRTIPIVFVTCPTLLVLASSQIWRGPAQMSPASYCMKRASPANGWACSRRLRRGSRA